MLRAYAISSVLALTAILVLVGLGVHGVYYHHIIRHSQAQAIQRGEAIFEWERALLTRPGRAGRRLLDVAPEDFAALDERMKRYLRPMEIVKVRVFAPDGRVVYSTDRSAIGQVDPANDGLARALTGQAVSILKSAGRVRDLQGEPRYDIDLVETYVPIRDGARIIGSFETYTDITWARAEIARVLGLSLLIVLAVLLVVFGVLFLVMRALTRQMSGVQRDLETMATTDGLTGLANRRYLMIRAEEECARLERHRGKGARRSEVGFIMADLDHFKKVNDVHGHLAGDEIVREAAARIRRVIRRYDIAGRYGGDEFLILLPTTDAEETRGVAERLWQAVRDTPFVISAGTEHVTISLGVSCASVTNDDMHAALRRADAALYQAKQEGRDRIAFLFPAETAET